MSKKSTNNNKSNKYRSKLKNSILEFLASNPKQGFNYKQIASKLGITSKSEKKKVLIALEELLLDGDLKETKPGKFKQKYDKRFITGIIELAKHGGGYVINDVFDEDIFIPPGKTKNTLAGDEVKVLLYAHKKGKKPEGEVVELIKRHKNEFVGTLEVSDKFAFLIPDSKKMGIDIFIPLKYVGGGKTGEKAVVKITDWPETAKSPFGKVERILGKAGEHKAEMDSIILEFGLPTSFSDEIIHEAESLPSKITKNEISKRRDFRGITTFTIDPEDAKDFDDALSIKKLSNGNWEIGIHIADVTHYVKPKTQLDNEAFERGTSVYLVDRVIPMLPEKLSNKLCSLRPNEEKLTFSAVFELDDKAHIHNQWFGRSIILSDKRFTYEEAQAILEKGKGPFAKELITFNNLAKILRKRKFEQGAISFETEEVKFKLDKNGKPLEIIKKFRKDANMLIEDFMLLANRKVAEFIFLKKESLQETPFVYRVHDAPPSDKLENFVKIARRFGYEFDVNSTSAISESFNRLLEKVQGKPEQNMIESLAIRTMAKAVYTSEKSSHYGLAFDYYTHFTSPIRRYPDVIAHRLLYHYLTDSKAKVDQEEIEKQCQHLSLREVKAEEAERASIKYKQVEYMTGHLGEEFDGIISGVIEKGIFVELLENKCEGLVPMSALDDDYYIFDEENYAIRGMHTHKKYQLGDLVRVIIASANVHTRRIDMELVQILDQV